LLVNIVGGPDLTLPRVNEVMTAITDQFGRDSHIIMGAVIDENLAGRVELCVVGTSDLGGRNVAARRPAAPARPKGAAAPAREPVAATPAAPAPAAVPEPVPGAPVAQEEFGFGEIETRGQFERTERNLFDGQDLDVPTYLRRGIKVSL
jgi:cell division protein FtsZ